MKEQNNIDYSSAYNILRLGGYVIRRNDAYQEYQDFQSETTIQGKNDNPNYKFR